MDAPKVDSFYVGETGDLLHITEVTQLSGRGPMFSFNDNTKILYKWWRSGRCMIGAMYGLDQWKYTKSTYNWKEITKAQFECALQFPVV